MHSWRESHDVKEKWQLPNPEQMNIISWWVSWKVISYVFMPQNAVDDNIIDLFKKGFDRLMEYKSNEGC